MPLPRARTRETRATAKRPRVSASSTSTSLSSPASPPLSPSSSADDDFIPFLSSTTSASPDISDAPSSSFLTSHEAQTSSYIDAHTKRRGAVRRKTTGPSPSLVPLHLSIQQHPDLWPPPSTLPLLTRRPSLSTSLLSSHRPLFPSWVLHLKAGASVLLSGFGSKKALVTSFARQFLTDGPVVVVNGYCPHLSARHLLSALTSQVMASPQSYRDIGQQLSDVVRFFTTSQSSIPHVYLLVHSLDGPALRSPALQSLLSTLAALPSLHLLATVDAVRCPLLWDPPTFARFRFTHFRVDTWAPYEVEVRAAGLAFLEEEGRGGGHGSAGAGRGIREVVQSLTPRHRQILHVIATLFIQRTQARAERKVAGTEAEAEDGPDKEAGEAEEKVGEGEGSGSRSVLLASAEVAEACDAAMVGKGEAGLRRMMEELIDHQLVKAVYPQGKGGQLFYTVPQPIDLVRSFYLEGGEEGGAGMLPPPPLVQTAPARASQSRRGRGRGRGGGRVGSKRRGAAMDVDEDEEKEGGVSAGEGEELEEGFGVYRLSAQPVLPVEDDDDGFDL